MKNLKKVALGVGTTISSFALAATPALAKLGTVEIPEKGYATSIGSVLTSVLNLIMLIAAILVFLYLILGGIEWITSGGDKGKTEGARNKITAAIVGLIILAASYALLQLALSVLGFSGGLNEVFESGIKPIN